jgi:tetratricopeptide (TPR) repeat protein
VESDVILSTSLQRRLIDRSLGAAFQYVMRGDEDSLKKGISIFREIASSSHNDPRTQSMATIGVADTARMLYTHTWEGSFLSESIDHYRRARDLFELPPHDQVDIMLASNLASSIVLRVQNEKELYSDNSDMILDLTEAIIILRDTLPHCELTSQFHLPLIHHLGIALSTLYDRSEKVDTLTEAISFFRNALDLTPTGHSDHARSLWNLGDALWRCYTQTLDIEVLEEAIQILREAIVVLAPTDLQYRSGTQSLADALTKHHEITRSKLDLVDAISLYRKMVKLRPLGDINRHGSLNQLASALFQLGTPDASKEALNVWREALELTPVGHINHRVIVGNFAKGLANHFDMTGDHTFLSESIRVHHQLLDLITPADDLEAHIGAKIGLCRALLQFSRHTGDLTSLLDSISARREVLSLRPPGHEHHETALERLAVSLEDLFERFHHIEVLGEVVQLRRELAKYPFDEHPDHFQHSPLLSLGASLLRKGEYSGDTEALEESLSIFRQRLGACPPNHAYRATALSQLGMALIIKGERTVDPASLEEAVYLLREAVSLYPSGDILRASSLNELGLALLRLFQRNGEAQIIDESIQQLRMALALQRSSESASSGGMAANLASALSIKFEQNGDVGALHEAVVLLREAVDLSSASSTGGQTLGELGNALAALYREIGGIERLSEVIQCHRQVLELRPPGHSLRILSLNNLSTCLRLRQEYSNDRQTMKEIFLLEMEALELTPPEHPLHATSAANSAQTLQFFSRMSDSDEVESTLFMIRFHKQALATLPPTSPARADLLVTLASALAVLLSLSVPNKDQVFEEIVELQNQVIKMRRPGHPKHARTLLNFSKMYMAKFEHDPQDESILHRALSMQRQSLEFLDYGHPERFQAHYGIAETLLRISSQSRWSEAIDHMRAGLRDANAPVRLRLQDIFELLFQLEVGTSISPDSYERMTSEAILDLYTDAVALLPRVAHLGLDSASRLRELSGLERICRFAAVRAAITSRDATVFELLEEGKVVFWTQALQLRSAALETLDPETRDTLLGMFRKLEREEYGSVEDKLALEQLIESRRQLNSQAEVMIEQIRARPGFDRFLKLPQFERLCDAARGGVVVALIANESRCFASVIDGRQHLARTWHKELDLTPRQLQDLNRRVSYDGMRGLADEPCYQDSSRQMQVSRVKHPHTPLADIWSRIVRPILRELKILVSAHGRRSPNSWF